MTGGGTDYQFPPRSPARRKGKNSIHTPNPHPSPTIPEESPPHSITEIARFYVTPIFPCALLRAVIDPFNFPFCGNVYLWQKREKHHEYF